MKENTYVQGHVLAAESHSAAGSMGPIQPSGRGRVW